MRRIGLLLLAALLLAIPARAEVRWGDFDLTAEAMDRALTLSEESREREQPQDWIGLLAFAAARCGGSPSSRDVVSAYHSLQSGASPRTLLGGNDAAFRYYREAYGAVLGGLAGRYAVRVNGEWKPAWGIKAFSPIAAGWPYTHEMCIRDSSEAYAAGELKHGTISLIEQGTLCACILTQPELYEKMVSNMVEVRSRGGYLMALTNVGNYNAENTADFTVYIPRTDPHFTPVLAIVPLQLFAYYVSCAKGLDVDKPCLLYTSRCV